MTWQLQANELKKRGPKHILFMCVANSVRSQMAEGIARTLAPSTTQISSAGSSPARVHPASIQVLRELNIDISKHTSKGLDQVDLDTVDAVITLCTDEVCPHLPHPVLKIHWPLPNPWEIPDDFRKIRDELLKRLSYLFDKTL